MMTEEEAQLEKILAALIALEDRLAEIAQDCERKLKISLQEEGEA